MFLIYAIIDALHLVLLYIISMGMISKEWNLRQTEDNFSWSGLSSMLSGQPSEYRDLIAQEVTCSCAAWANCAKKAAVVVFADSVVVVIVVVAIVVIDCRHQSRRGSQKLKDSQTGRQKARQQDRRTGNSWRVDNNDDAARGWRWTQCEGIESKRGRRGREWDAATATGSFFSILTAILMRRGKRSTYAFLSNL